ncbi:MAG TPA: rhomboid family intramembrane serine protease [Anaeromyxobacter sp.]|nr:rhomboid family intramembrane serine protease [Anaeromyxobacter sp.]
MLIPVGLDETRLARLPWVSIAILALNVLAYVATSTGAAGARAEARFDEVVEYWRAHPYLEVPAELERRFGVGRDELAAATNVAVPERAPPGAWADQAELDALVEDLVAEYEATPARRWSLVPERGLAQPGWITHQFTHGSLGHLLGNMLVFALVVAPFLEDAWGRPFFLAFYLAGGVAAGAAQALPMGDSPVGVLGASGAISACLGAFALRFAHRRVRMFYWFGLVFRGTFFVPAWLYAFLGLAGDLLGLKLQGVSGGVAYAAHVGGFLFGLAAVVAMRATGLEDRIAPDDAPRWGRTAAASRGSDALAAGRVSDARRHLENAIARDPRDLASVLALARIHAAAFDRERTTPLVERLVREHLGRKDAAAARSVLLELGAMADPAAFRPAVAYRAAELVAAEDPGLADRLDEVAASAGGPVAAKALLRSAERARAYDPARAARLAARARDAEGATAELRARADALAGPAERGPERRVGVPSRFEGIGESGPASGAGAPARVETAAREGGARAAPAPALAPAEASGERWGEGVPPPLGIADEVKVVSCRLLGASPAGLDLEATSGRRAVVPPARVAALAAGVLREHARAGQPLRNAVVLDLLLHPRPGDAGRVVLRLLGADMALKAIHPDAPPREAYARIVDALVAASGAPASPSRDAAAGRPFSGFADLAAFERSAWGRPLAGVG